MQNEGRFLCFGNEASRDRHVGRLVGWSVGWSVGYNFQKSSKYVHSTILSQPKHISARKSV